MIWFKKAQRLRKQKLGHTNIWLAWKKDLWIPCGSHWCLKPTDREDYMDYQKFIRPIADYTPRGTSMLTKYLNGLLKPCEKIAASRINDAFDFAYIIITVKPESDETAVSLNRTFLYTNVPIKNRLDYLHSILITEISLGERCNLAPADIIIGVELSLPPASLSNIIQTVWALHATGHCQPLVTI